MGMAMDHIIVVVMLLSATTIDNPVHAACNLRGGHQTTDHSSANDIFSLALRDESLLLGSQRRIQAIPADGQDGGEYIQQCESFLSDPNVADDGIISQIDFADMLLHQCHLDNLCPNKFTLKFEQLDVPLQLKFIKGICHHEELTDRFDCIRDLEDMWLEGDEFGFDADAEDVDDLVKDMCLETFVDAVEMGFAMTQGELDVLCSCNCVCDKSKLTSSLLNVFLCSTNGHPKHSLDSRAISHPDQSAFFAAITFSDNAAICHPNELAFHQSTFRSSDFPPNIETFYQLSNCQLFDHCNGGSGCSNR